MDLIKYRQAIQPLQFLCPKQLPVLFIREAGPRRYLKLITFEKEFVGLCELPPSFTMNEPRFDKRKARVAQFMILLLVFVA
jgi:hypothetical protein